MTGEHGTKGRYVRLGLIPTFRQFLVQQDHNLEDLTSLEVDVHWSHYDQLVWQHVTRIREAPNRPHSLGALNHFLAEDVIADHLGADWVNRNVVNADLSSQTRNYITLGEHRLLKALSLHRIQELARRLYQLQSFPWFESVLDGVRTRELSGAAFEMDVLWLMQIASPHVETRSEIGEKGSDYDAFALMTDRLVPVEAKAKDDQTPWSEKTVINTVRAAARQFPKGGVGLLFLRIPTAWVGPRLEADYTNVLAEATRQTSRIGAVVTVIDKPHLLTEKTASVSRHFDLFATTKCPDHIWQFCRRLTQLWDAGLTHMAPDPPF
ncbi:hypothetical protein [Micromonospora aurantiaca (nom. illeg.)]|uniref:hypothetical protein n=1 Tax=Micromonospora aurantiaca (nom. illeg.) TaxID=47850 RepID=UPI0033C0097D